MGEVIRQQCDSTSDFEAYHGCVKRNWYNGIPTSSFGDQDLVEFAMETGRHLLEQVRAGKLTDSEAKYEWKSVQMELSSEERIRRAAAAAAFRSSYSSGSSGSSAQDELDELKSGLQTQCILSGGIWTGSSCM